MKIRSGFVSNSSSSSYIVEVPNDMKITRESFKSPNDNCIGELCEWWGELKETDDNIVDDDGIIVEQEAVDILNGYLDTLRAGNGIYLDNGYLSKEPPPPFWLLVQFLENNNCVVTTTDGPGGDGEDQIIPFEDMRKKKKKS